MHFLSNECHPACFPSLTLLWLWMLALKSNSIISRLHYALISVKQWLGRTNNRKRDISFFIRGMFFFLCETGVSCSARINALSRLPHYTNEWVQIEIWSLSVSLVEQQLHESDSDSSTCTLFDRQMNILLDIVDSYNNLMTHTCEKGLEVQYIKEIHIWIHVLNIN